MAKAIINLALLALGFVEGWGHRKRDRTRIVRDQAYCLLGRDLLLRHLLFLEFSSAGLRSARAFLLRSGIEIEGTDSEKDTKVLEAIFFGGFGEGRRDLRRIRLGFEDLVEGEGFDGRGEERRSGEIWSVG